MNILVCGANGFVGRHLTQALRHAGHTVVRGVRAPCEPGDVAIDYRQDTRKEAWLPRLDGIEAVINAVGVLRDSADTPMARLHMETPAALFETCAEAGVERIVQVSALGVDRGIDTPYFVSRRRTESVLRDLPNRIRILVLRPPLIYGEDGSSARMFRFLARLPLHLLPMGGRQSLQPVHIDDICASVVRWLSDPDSRSQTVSAVGAEATTLRGMLDSYRAQANLPGARHLAVPSPLMKLAARLGDHVPASPLCSDTLHMLLAGSTADADAFEALLGHAPLSFRTFITTGASHENG